MGDYLALQGLKRIKNITTETAKLLWLQVNNFKITDKCIMKEIIEILVGLIQTQSHESQLSKNFLGLVQSLKFDQDGSLKSNDFSVYLKV